MPNQKITQNVVFINGKSIDSADKVGYTYTSMDGKVQEKTFKEAAAASNTIVFECREEGNEHLNAIWARGHKFGGGVAVNTTANTFSANGANYTLAINDNGKLEIQKFVPITGVTTSGSASWEWDSGAKSDVSWHGSYEPLDASDTIVGSWEPNTENTVNNYTISRSNNGFEGDTITFSNIPNNATVSFNFNVTQNNVTVTNPKKIQAGWWKRKSAIFISSNENLTPKTVIGNTSGGFRLIIDGTEYSWKANETEAKNNCIPDNSSKDDLSYWNLAKSFGETYGGYIYVLWWKNYASGFEANINGGMAKERFDRVSSAPIKTYSDGAQSLYLYRSSGAHDNLSKIALTNITVK